MRILGRITAGILAVAALSGASDGPKEIIVMRKALRAYSVDAEKYNVTFRTVPTAASVQPTTFPLPSNRIVFSTSAGAECRQYPGNKPIDPARCAKLPVPDNAISVSVQAAGNAAVRTIVFDPAQLKAAAQTIAAPESLCGTSIAVNGQQWRLSCDPNDIKGSFLRSPVTATPVAGSLPLADGLTFDTSVGAQCLDAATGKQADQSACANSPVPPTIGRVTVQARTEPLLRRVLIDPAAILAFAPTVTNTASLCSGGTVNLTGQAWEIVCSDERMRFHYAKKPTAIVLTAPSGGAASVGTAPNYAGTLSFSTRSAVQCIDTDDGKPTDQALCQYAPDPVGVGDFSVPATFSPAFRTAAFDKAALAKAVPALSSSVTDAQCGVSFTRQPSSGPRELWQTSCDPASVSGQYVKVGRQVSLVSPPSRVGASVGQPQYSGTLSVSTLAGFLCRDLTTGAAAADATKCNYLPNNSSVAQFSIPATFSPDFRTVLVDPQDILSRAPEVTNVSSFCTGSLTMSVPSGSNETWKTSCTPSDIVQHYRKVPKSVSVLSYPNDSSISSTSGRPDYASTMQVSTLVGVQCLDTATGQTATDTTKCQYLANPATVGQFSIPVTVAPRFRTAYMDPAEILKVSPTVTNATSLCGATFTFGVSIGYTNESGWKLTCDRNDVSGNFARYGKTVSLVGDVASYGPTGAGPNYAAVAPYQITASTLVGYGCRDTDTGRDAADPTRCTYAVNPTTVAQFQLKGTVSPQTRKVLIDYNDVLKVAPEVTNAQSLCTRTFTMAIVASSNESGWSYTCNPEDVRLHYVRYGRSVYSTSDPSADYQLGPVANFQSSMGASTLVGYGCRDSDNGQDAPLAKCAYSANPTTVATFAVPVTVSPLTRKVLIDYRDVLKIAPEVADAQALCTRTFTMPIRYSSNDAGWSYTCNPEDIRPHYVRYGKSVYASSDPASDYVLTPSANYVTTMGVSTLVGYGCRDTDNGQEAAAGKCTYSANPASVVGTSIKATVSAQTRKVLIDYNDVLKFAPEVTNAQALCTRTFSMPIRYSNNDAGWSYTCNPEDIRTHYVRYGKSVYAAGAGSSTYPTAGANFASYVNVSTLVGYGCRDTDDGSDAAVSHCTFVANPTTVSTFNIPATVSPQTRNILVSVDDVLKVAPEVANVQNVCSGNVTMTITNGSTYYGAWTTETFALTCDPEKVRLHYVRYGKTVSVNGSLPTSTYGSVGASNATTSVTVNTYSGYGCRDTDTGEDAPSVALCNYAPNPPSVSSFSVPVTMSGQNRTALFNPADILKVAPEVTNAQSVCSGSITSAVTNGSTYQPNWTYETFARTCDPEKVRTHFVRYGKAVVLNMGLPSTVRGSIGDADFSVSAGINTLAGYGCRDTDDGSEAPASSCSYLSNPATVGSSSIPATVSPRTRRILVNSADVLKFAPEVANPQAVCSGTVQRAMTNDTTYTPYWTYEYYTLTCNPSDIVYPYQSQAKTVTPGQYSFTGTMTSSAAIPDTAATISTNQAAGCWDPRATSFADDSACAYGGGSFPKPGIPVTMRPSIKKAVVSRAAVLSLYPYMTNIEAFCTAGLRVGFTGNSTIESGWTMSCTQ